MFTMTYDIQVGSYQLGMLEKVEINRSVELLADTAVITLPAAEYNKALEVEDKIRRGDKVTVRLGYSETGLREEFAGYVQRVGTDNGAITLECEDELYKFRVGVKNQQLSNIALKTLLDLIIKAIGGGYAVDCSYGWTYEKFVINSATGFDILKKIQEESGADIYVQDNVLHVHAPGEKVGKDVIYDFSQNVQSCDLTYRRADERRVEVIVKAVMPDGKVKEKHYGTTGGDKVTVKCATSDDASMKLRGESEHKRLTFDGYDGSITTWLVPAVVPGDSADLYDADYDYKNGRYYIRAVKTEFSSSGATRNIELGFRLS